MKNTLIHLLHFYLVLLINHAHVEIKFHNLASVSDVILPNFTCPQNVEKTISEQIIKAHLSDSLMIEVLEELKADVMPIAHEYARVNLRPLVPHHICNLC